MMGGFVITLDRDICSIDVLRCTMCTANLSQNFGSKARHQSLAADGDFVLRKYQNNACLRKMCNRVKVMHLSGIYAPLGRLASSLESLHICENMHPYKKMSSFQIGCKIVGAKLRKGPFYSKLLEPETPALSRSADFFFKSP